MGCDMQMERTYRRSRPLGPAVAGLNPVRGPKFGLVPRFRPRGGDGLKTHLSNLENPSLNLSQTLSINLINHPSPSLTPSQTLQDPPGTPQAPQEVVFSRFSSDRTGSLVFFRRIVVGPSEHAQDPRILFGTLGLRSERFLDPPRPLNNSGLSLDTPESTGSLLDDPERPPTPLDAPQGSRSLANASRGPRSAAKRPRTPQRGPRTPETSPEPPKAPRRPARAPQSPQEALQSAPQPHRSPQNPRTEGVEDF
ncbi:hypothetical protein PGTUg99_011373 [Puccinia graminis f. sp. tritici]|uniref:Uncharacterized protein n=1 Tax=Puccinia graminis f. sp. tritici TaxID=56615 RepID=A0A5B0LSK5_PUCGR|nr:hypothetical protein PGTUg99_011373 [Puccinia graminis f. sp. tritici]